jgi:hypothetical protein
LLAAVANSEGVTTGLADTSIDTFSRFRRS